MRPLPLVLLFALIFTMAQAENVTHLSKTPPPFNVGKMTNFEVPFSTVSELKGDVVLVEFFRTSCPGCVAILGTTQRTYEKYTRRDFHLITTSNDTVELMRRFMFFEGEGLRMNFPVASRSMASWGVSKLPMAYVIGRDGKVCWADNPNNSYEKALAAALEAVDPDMPEAPSSSKAICAAYSEGKFAKAIADSTKAASKDEKFAAFAQYIKDKVSAEHARLVALQGKYKTSGDMWMACKVYEDRLGDFKGTEYEEELKNAVQEMKNDRETAASMKEWKSFHSILAAARTGKKSDRDKGIADLKRFLSENTQPELRAMAKDYTVILGKPWTLEDAAVFGDLK